MFALLVGSWIVTGCMEQGENSSEPDVDRLELSEYTEQYDPSDADSLIVYPEDTDPDYSIRFTKEWTIGGFEIERETNPMLSYLFSVDNQERLYIWSDHVRVYDSDGRYITTIGSRGSGPGEFRTNSRIKPVIHGEKLYVYDGTLNRINLFSLNDFSFLKAISISPDSWEHIEALKGYRPTPRSHPQYFFVQNDSTLLLGFRQPFMSEEGIAPSVGNPNPDREQYIRFYQLNMEGEIISEEIVSQIDVNFYPGPGVSGATLFFPVIPFVRSSLIAVSDQGRIFTAWSEEFQIEVYDENGDFLRAFNFPYTQATVNREDVIDSYHPSPPRQLMQSLQDAEILDTWPAIHNMLVDDENRLWVSTIIDNEEYFEWWVLDEYGKLLAKFRWPGKRLNRHRGHRVPINEIMLVKGGYLYEYEEIEPWYGIITRYQVVLEEK